jgi:hypothetical protein
MLLERRKTVYVRTSFIVSLLSGIAFAQPPEDSAVFKRIFGVSRILPADIVEQVKAIKPGEKLKRDINNDGKVDELWYIDTVKRHTISPMLVRVVDEDGDMDKMQRGDLDSDLYFWDHNADGYVDVVTDYLDDDGDGDLDRMGIFYDKEWPDRKESLTVWWADDIGDDNLLWYDVNGNYYQPLCQWRTNFNGDELFYQFRLTSDSDKWINVWEDPFAFYDRDGDGISEEVVRISAVGHDVQNLRYSIDADDDAYGENRHNYDFSITALPPESGISSEGPDNVTIKIRGIDTMPMLRWEKTKEFAQRAAWGKAMLTWDEINSNTDEIVEQDPNERWEGVLNHKSKHDDFVQVGGPPSSAFNKRVEVSDKPSSPLGLNYDSADHRFHLLGAKYGYMDVDYNLDGKLDAAYTWSDENGDGVLDHRTADVDADGTVDFEGALEAKQKPYDLEFDQIAPVYPQRIAEVLNDSQLFIDLVSASVKPLPVGVQEIIDYYGGPLASFHLEREIGLRIQNSPAGARFYMDLVRDRLFAHLRQGHNAEAGWNEIETAYLQGNYAMAAKRLATFLHVAMPSGDAVRPLKINNQSYSRRICLRTKPETQPDEKDTLFENVPETLDISHIREGIAPDFNPRNCVVVDGDYWLTWRTIPHQIDNWDFGDNEQLSFLMNIRGGEKKTYYIYYSPEGEQPNLYPILTGAVLDTPAYVAWESDAGAYRFYTGQFDFFGKQVDRLIPRTERLLYPIVGENYHQEQEWGIDALHVEKTSGLGGLTLYANGKEYPVQSPAGIGDVKFEHRVLGAGPVRCAVEILAKNVIPESPEKVVAIRCFIYAHHPESEIHVRLPNGLDNPKLAPGLLKLVEDSWFENEKYTVMGTWGRQGDDIGEIGLAIVHWRKWAEEIVELPAERRWMSTTHYAQEDWQGYHYRYWIVGTWRRGMQYPVSPTMENWKRTVENLGRQLNTWRNSDHIAAITVPTR